MITTTGNRIENIRRVIDFFIHTVSSNKIMGNTGVSKELEMLTLSIYRNVENNELIYLDLNNKNSKTIDLIDKTGTLGIQVTSQSTPNKVKKTSNSFLNNEKCKNLKSLKILIYTAKNVSKEFILNGCKITTLNIYDYLNEIWAYSPEKVNKFEELIKNEIEPLLNPFSNSNSSTFPEYKDSPINQVSKNRIKDKTSNDVHFIEIIYNDLKTIDGFNYIPKSYIANLNCFNLTQRIDGNYYLYNLKSQFPYIKELINGIQFEKGKLRILNTEFIPYETKLNFIFNKLFNNGFYIISYMKDYKITSYLRINLKNENKTCDCPRCLLSAFKFDKALHALKDSDDLLPKKTSDLFKHFSANFKLGRFNKAFIIGQKLKNRRKTLSEQEYFFCLTNIYFIKSFLFSGENDKIKNKIKEINLNDELENLSISDNSKNILRDINYNVYFNNIYTETENYVAHIQNTKRLLMRGDYYFHGENHTELLLYILYEVYNLSENNFYLIDEFGFHSKIYTNIFQGLLISHSAPSRYKYKFVEFDYDQIRLFLYYTDADEVLQTIKDMEYRVSQIKIDQRDQNKIINLISNYYNSFFLDDHFLIRVNPDIDNINKIGFLSGKLRRIFNRIQLLITYGDFEDKKLIKLIPFLLKYLKTQKILQPDNLEYLGLALNKRLINLFSIDQIKELLYILVNNQNYFRSTSLISCFTENVDKNKNLLIKDKEIINKVLGNLSDKSNSTTSDYLLLIYYYKISSKSLKLMLKKALIRRLKLKLDWILYHECCAINILDPNDFINEYMNIMVAQSGPNDIKIEDGVLIIPNLTGINFINFILKNGIDIKNPKIQEFSKKSDFYDWIINHNEFDYSKFHMEWLQFDYKDYIIEKLKDDQRLKEIINLHLDKSKLSSSVKLLLN